jgi:hypothetical protein
MQESGTGHVVVLRQFDGRRVIHMWDSENGGLHSRAQISGDIRLNH